MEVQVGDFCHCASLVESIAKFAHAMDTGRFIFLSASLVLKLWHAVLSGVGRQVVRLLGAMSGIPGVSVQLPLPAVSAAVKCIWATADANLFAMEHNPVVIEAVPFNFLLLPVGSVCRVLRLGLDPRTGLVYLTMQAWDVPCCYGEDSRVLFMRTLMWTGTVRCVWLPTVIADTLPVCRLSWVGFGAEQESDQVATAPEVAASAAAAVAETPRIHATV